MMNKKSEIRTHLEQVFKRFRPKREVPPNLKEDVFRTLENLNVLDDASKILRSPDRDENQDTIR